MKVYVRTDVYGVEIVSKENGTLIEIDDDFDFTKLHLYDFDGTSLVYNESRANEERQMEEADRAAELESEIKASDTPLVDILLEIIKATTVDELLETLEAARKSYKDTIEAREALKKQLYGVPEWIQPTGAHDAYSIGAEVTHGGKVWVSDVGGNVWEPGVYGWTEVPTT